MTTTTPKMAGFAEANSLAAGRIEGAGSGTLGGACGRVSSRYPAPIHVGTESVRAA